MSALKDLAGQKFGRLTVARRGTTHVLPSGQRQTMWDCLCDCGNTTTVNTGNLKSGRVVSCGCYKREVQKRRRRGTHGYSRTRLYNIWHKMRQRCSWERAEYYDRYGGRGIEVCREWGEDFSNFCAWALRSGYDDSLSIDRVDADGDYEPANCRWVTMKAQENNRANNVIVEHDGKSLTLAEWADECGLKYTTFYERLKRGWSFHDALTKPVRKRGV